VDVTAEVLIIAVGNEYRGDDAVGLALARALQNEPPPGATIVEQSGDGTALLDAWRGARAVIVLDAVAAGEPPGTVLRLDAHSEPIPVRLFSHSTHAFGVAEAVELARALGELPDQLIIYGVQGADFAPGTVLSAPVAGAIDEVLRCIWQEVAQLREHGGRHDQ
jgi:hydrogenase maturation protease